MQLALRTLLATTAAATVVFAADSLPTAPYARVNAASVVADAKWLLIGGTPALKNTDKNYTAAATAIGRSITQLDLASKVATAVKTTVNSTWSINRSQVSGQICEYDANKEKVYCFGGITPAGRLAPGVGVFNSAKNTWEQDQDTDIPLRAGSASILVGNTVYIFGGNDTSGELPADLQSFSTADLTSARVFTNGAYPSGRVGHCIAGLNDTAFLLVGGESAPGKTMNDAWVFDTVARQWRDVSNVMSNVSPIRRSGVACTKVGAQVALFGGVGGSKPSDDIWLINNSTLKLVPTLFRRGAYLWARQTDAGGSAGSPTARVGAQIANLNNYVGIAGGQGASTDSAMHFFDAQGSGGWVPSTAALTRALDAAAPLAGTSTTRPAASSATSGRPVPTAGQNAGGVPNRPSSSVAAPTSTRVIPGAGQNAASAPPTSATPAAAASPAGSTAANPTPAAATSAPQAIPAVPVPIPVPGQNAGGIPTTTPAGPASTTSTTTAKPTKTRAPIFRNTDEDTDNILLAVLLALPIALAAGLCLLCACFAARRDHKKHANWRQYYRHPDTAVREQPGQRSGDVYNQPATGGGGVPMAAAAGATTAAAVPATFIKTTTATTSVSRTATPIRHTQAPGTPHRSDSRRRVHSPPGGAVASSATQQQPSHANINEPARTAKRYRVLWASTPSQLDEVEAAAGDIVEEKRVFADGWAMVHNITKGATGMIPMP
ncbi:hypothetical protein HDU86_006264 [Geranomyces michiganensis]|nr:hypothetical protein HDU86_006264 [Geranomyces michiganensis]